MGIETEASLILRAKDAASAVLDKVGAKVKGFTAAVQRNASAIRTAGVAMTGAGIAGMMAAKMIVDGAAKIETAMANVNTMLDKGQDAHAMFNDEINRLITTIPVAGGKVEALNGMYMILSAGIEAGAKATAFLEEAMKAAKAGMTDVSTAVDAMTSIMNAYASVGYEASQINDMLFQGVRLGKTNYQELGQAIGPVVAFTAQLGVAAMESISTIATLTKAGLQTKRAGTAVRGMMLAFMKPSEEMQRAIQENASGWGVMTSEMTLAQKELSKARDIFSDASYVVAGLTAALEAGAPVPAKLAATLSKAKGEVQSTRDEFQRHADALRDMQDQYDDASSAVKGLSDEMAVISLEESKNRLEIMRIRQLADDEGRDMTADELARISMLEEANDRLAIKSGELAIKQKEIQIEQSARTDLIDKEKSAMEGLNVKIAEQEGVVDDAQGSVDEWSANWEKTTQAQLAAAELQKTAAQSSMGAWQENLDKASASAVTMMLETHGLQASLHLLSDAVDGDKAALAALFPNAEAMVGVLPLVGEMAITAAEDLKAMEESAGAAGEAYEKVADTTISKTEKLATRMEIAKESMADGATPAMLKLNEATVWAAEGLAYYNQESGGFISAMMTYGSAALSAIGPIMGLIGQLAMLKVAKLATAAATGQETAAESVSRISKIKSALVTAKATISQWAHNVSLYANPIMIVVLAIIAIIAALYILTQHTDKVTDAFKKLGEWIMGGLQKAWDLILAGFEGIKKGMKGVRDFFMGAFNKIRNGLLDAGKAVGNWVKGVGEKYEKAKKLVKEKLGEMVKAGVKKFDEFKRKAIAAATKMNDKYKAVFNKMKGFAKKAAGKVAGYFSDLKNKASKWGEELGNKFRDGMAKAGDRVKKGAADLGGKIKKALGFSRPPPEGPLKNIIKWGSGLVENYMDGVKKKMPFIGGIMDKIGGKFKGWGKGAIGSFSKSIEDGKDNLKKALEKIGSTAKDFLGFSTPPPKGDLHHMPEWGGHGLDSWGGGMLKRLPAFQKQLNEASASLALNLPTPTLAEGSGDTTIGTQDMSNTSNEWHIYPPAGDPENIARMVGNILDRRAMKA